MKLVTEQFNSISSCNMLKWGPFNPRPGIYRHENADRYVAFGTKNNMEYIVGHVLFWHNQTPAWVFRDTNGKLLEREQLLKRMRERVRHVSKRYGNRIDAWDVVNESILGDGKLRDSKWTKIIGKDFIEQAFRIAREELPAEVQLLYFGANINDRRTMTNKNNPYTDGLPEEMQQKLAKRYAEIFQLFLKHKDKIKRVTFWGTTDMYSWLNNWPIKGRTNYPLLFDRAGKPKAAFHAVTALGEQSSAKKEPKSLLPKAAVK